MDLLAVTTTVATHEQAQALACALVEQRLAACAQIERIESFYIWDGELRQEAEFRLQFKTTSGRYAAAEAALRTLHPYELPAIHAVRVEHALEAYARWVEDSTRAVQC